MRHLVLAALVAAFFFSCASAPIRHPSPEHPIGGCVISCPDGFSFRGQHLCRSGKRWLLNVQITGEDDVPGDPSESRWFTGLSSFQAEFTVKERLAAAGLRQGTLEWSRAYGDILKDVQRELGRDALAAYNKQDVVLESCESFIRSHCLSRTSREVLETCASHPGEVDPRSGQPFSPP